MSRSRKKTPGWCDRNPDMKRYANHVVRRHKLEEDLVDGSGYKRYFDSWNIHDYKCLYHSWQEVHEFYFNSRWYTPEEMYKAYMK